MNSYQPQKTLQTVGDEHTPISHLEKTIGWDPISKPPIPELEMRGVDAPGHIANQAVDLEAARRRVSEAFETTQK